MMQPVRWLLPVKRLLWVAVLCILGLVLYPVTRVAQWTTDTRIKPVLSTSPLWQENSDALRLPSHYQFSVEDLRRQFDFDPDGPSDVLVFLHMQKVAGTFFGKNLVNNLKLKNPCSCTKEEGMLNCPCKSSDGQRLWLFSRYSIGWKCGLHADFTELMECLSSGKMDELENRHRERRYLLMTVIREPLSRYISEWQHVQRGASWLGATLRCNSKTPTLKQLPFCFQGASWDNVTLDEFMACPYNLAHNRQTRMLANLSLVGCYDKGLMDDPVRKQIMLQSAKDNLRNMAYFSIMHYPNESQYLFEHTFGLRFQTPFHKQRIRHQFNSADVFTSLPTNLQHRIEQNNDLDIELYRFAEQLFLARYKYARGSSV